MSLCKICFISKFGLFLDHGKVELNFEGSCISDFQEKDRHDMT